jgi:tetratricopeptide (TPR) repeat protein
MVMPASDPDAARAYAKMDEAWSLRGRGQLAEADNLYSQAIQIFETLIQRNAAEPPSLANDRRVETLANMLGLRAELRAQLGDLAFAREDAKRALMILDRVRASGDYLASIDDEYGKLQNKFRRLGLQKW